VRPIGSFDDELNRATRKLKARGLKSLIYRLAWSGALYHLWMDRNANREVDIVKSTMHDVRCRLLARKGV
jgi:hypothetical protein